MDAVLFDGLKVIDCGSFIAAPAAATILSDFGADVIKIEPPGAGDPYRALPGLPGNPVSDHNYGWMLDSRNKRSLALDLGQPRAQEVLHRLVADADVFVTNYPLRVRTRLRIDHETLAPLNERLVYASFSGYGEQGEEAAKPGFDVTAWWARSGMMDIIRTSPEAAPVRPTVGMGDHPSAMTLFAAIVTALYQRERTGRGTCVSSSLLANGVWSNAYLAQAALVGAVAVPRPPREQALNALTTYYRCRDDRWLILTILNEDRYWPVLAACLGREDLTTDPRFATRADRHRRSTELVAVLDEVFATRDRDHWRDVLHTHGIVFDVVANPDDLAHDDQLVANDVVVPFEDGRFTTVDSPLSVGGATKTTPRQPPAVGEHSDEVLREAGFSDDEISSLREAGAVA
jgi:crotonobetainyl-CoA:carnitine CoA-transferase CaiB-like acyl-CoA transferase